MAARLPRLELLCQARAQRMVALAVAPLVSLSGSAYKDYQRAVLSRATNIMGFRHKWRYI